MLMAKHSWDQDLNNQQELEHCQPLGWEHQRLSITLILEGHSNLMTHRWVQHEPHCALPPQPCRHCSLISLCVNDGRSQLLSPHPFSSPLPLHRHAQQVVLPRDLLHSSLPSLLACVYQLATSDTMHMAILQVVWKYPFMSGPYPVFQFTHDGALKQRE